MQCFNRPADTLDIDSFLANPANKIPDKSKFMMCIDDHNGLNKYNKDEVGQFRAIFLMTDIFILSDRIQHHSTHHHLQ